MKKSRRFHLKLVLKITGTLSLAICLACISRPRLKSLVFKLLRKNSPLPEKGEQEDTYEAFSLTAPPVIQPLQTVEQLLTWIPVVSPLSPQSLGLDREVSSLLSKVKGEPDLPTFSPSQAEKARAKAASQARHTAFCTAPINSSRPPISHALCSNASLSHVLDHSTCSSFSSHTQQGAQTLGAGLAAASASNARIMVQPSRRSPSPVSALQDPLAPPCQAALAGASAKQAAEEHVATPDAQASTGSRPQLLVCHDLQGGYLNDRFVQGTGDPGSFRLWRWDCIDIFVYFSHHLVTIPPPAWIAAARRHNTKILGTLITEWGAGSRICKHLFSSKAMAQQVADQLVSIAEHHGFDGWLINIECELHPASRYIPNLLHFLAHLRARMKEVCGSHSSVIWYDAVTTEGHLRWQNSLTSLNYPFLDVSDGLFLNYHWKSDTPAKVAAVAGSRACDVFLGVDVHGRGTFGGGKASCDIALLVARMAGVSSAIFGPGWVYENFPESSEEEMEAWGPRHPLQSAPTSLPFTTSFCEGKGNQYWLQGAPVSSAPWHNLSALDPYPALLQPPDMGAGGSSRGKTLEAMCGETQVASSQPMSTTAGKVDVPAGPVPSPFSPLPASPATSDTVIRKAWLALDALHAGCITLRHNPVSRHSFSPTRKRDIVFHAAHSSSTSASSVTSEGFVALVRDRAFNGGSCLLVRPPCHQGPTASIPLLHPLYRTHIFIPPCGLHITYALSAGEAEAAEVSPSSSTAPQAGCFLAPALWIRPTPASLAHPAACEPVIAVLSAPNIPELEACKKAAGGLWWTPGCTVSVNKNKSNSSLQTAHAKASWMVLKASVPTGVLPVGAVIVGVGIVAWTSDCAVTYQKHSLAAEPAPAAAAGGGGRAASLARAAGQVLQQQSEQATIGGSVHLGHLAITAHVDNVPATLPLVPGLFAVNVTTLPLATTEDKPSLLLSCDLVWKRQLGLSSTICHPCALVPAFSKYHVWVCAVQGKNRITKWLWLGTAHTERFHCAIEVSGYWQSTASSSHFQLLSVCRPKGQALEVLRAGKATAVGSGVYELSEQHLEVVVQPVRAEDGFVAGPIVDCSHLMLKF